MPWLRQAQELQLGVAGILEFLESASGFFEFLRSASSFFDFIGDASGFFKFLGFAFEFFKFLCISSASLFEALKVIANVSEDLLVCTDISNLALR